MKKTTLKWLVSLLMLITLPVVLWSCSDDDDEGDDFGNYKELIVGKWTDTGRDGSYP